MKRYCVPVIYRGLENYVVYAENEEAAVAAATVLFEDGSPGDTLGNEFEVIEQIGAIDDCTLPQLR